MPRRNVQFVQGTYYHLYNRGAGRQSICRTEDDYHRLLRLIKSIAEMCQIAMIAYAILPNHYHWLVCQDGPTPANLLPKRVFGSYTRTYNRIHERTGTLFEARFEAKVVDSDAYLHQLCCYIHANPVRHGLAMRPELWPYSNYAEWMGIRSGTLVDQVFVQTHWPDRQRYQQFVHSYLSGQAALPPTLRDYLQHLEE